jgi:hypothetical protein
MSAPKLVPVCGWRATDAAEVVALHNYAAATVARSDLDEGTIRRRLLLLADMIKSTALSVFGDVEGEALAACDDFWARRASGERGDGEDA